MHLIETESVGNLLGLLEILDDVNGPTDIARLDDSLDAERTTFMNLLEDARAMDLVKIAQGDVTLTPLGKKLMKGDIETRKTILRDQIKKLEPFHTIFKEIGRRKDHMATKEEIMELLSASFPSDTQGKMFETVITWGRYSKLLEYDSDSEELVLSL